MEIQNESVSSLCIFCLKSIDNPTDDCNDQTSKTDQCRFFPLIFRHLLNNSALISLDNQEWCRNACKVISEIISDGDGDDKTSLFYENVQICHSCKRITRKFSELYHRMKEFELRIDLEVDKLRNVMGSVDEVASRLQMDELENRLTNEGAVTLGEFRDKLKQSCQVYQKVKKRTSFPKVQLIQVIAEKDSPMEGMEDGVVDIDMKFECSNITSEERSSAPQDVVQEYPVQSDGSEEYSTQAEGNNQRQTFFRDGIQVALQQDGNDNERSNNAKLTVVHPVMFNCENDLPQSPALGVKDEAPLSPPPASTDICTTCSLLFTSKLELFKHNMANHIGKYFSTLQPSTLTNDQYNKFITNFLENTMGVFEIVGKNHKCTFCSKVLSGRQRARRHLVAKHRPTLKENLMGALDNEKLPPGNNKPGSRNTLTTTTNITMKGKKGRSARKIIKTEKLQLDLYCSQCSRSFPSKNTISQHNLIKHPEKYFTLGKLESLTAHQFQNIVGHMLKVAVGEFQIVGSKYHCNFCTKLLSSKLCAKGHLIRKHRSVLNEKLVKLQNSSDVTATYGMNEGGNMSTTDRRLGGKKQSHGHICSICEKVFIRGPLLNHHRRCVHPEIFLERFNILPPSPENNNQRFKTYVRYVMEKQMEGILTKEADNDKVKCCICSKVWSSLQSARRHLISRHRDFLGGKLEDLQKSGKSFHEIKKELSKMKTETKVVEKKSPEEASENLGALDCFFCSITFKSKCIFFQHNMSHHIEKYFSSVKPIELSNELFKKHIIQLLNNTVDQWRLSNSKYQCSFCPELLPGKRTSKNHLVKKHRPILKEKLRELQKSGNVTFSNTTFKEGESSHNHVCNICGKIFEAGSMLNHHQRFNHPEIFFEHEKPIQLQGDVGEGQLFNRYVRYILEKQVDQEFIKTVRGATTQEMDPLGEPQSSELVEGTRKNIIYQCNFCSEALYTRKTAISHLVLKHQQNIAEILGGLREKSVEDIKLELAHFNFEVGSLQKVILRRRGTKRKLWWCASCSKYFKLKVNLFQHDMAHHIEKYFVSVKPKSVSDKQFKECIIHTIGNLVKNFKKIDSKYQCSFCSKQFRGINMARRHLLAKHGKIIGGKLAEVQKSGSTLQKGESSIISATTTNLRRKRGGTKGKSRPLNNSSVKS